MSKIKPVAWLYKARISGTDAWNTQVYSHKPVEDADWVKGITPLYTADQLAEAVAAEREKNLAAVEGARISSDGWGDPIDDGDCERNEGIDLALEAIRSTAK